MLKKIQSIEQNKRNLNRLRIVMRSFGLSKADVSRLAGVSRMMVTHWFAGRKKCPDHLPETIKATLEIQSPELNLQIMKRGLRKYKVKNPKDIYK